VSSAAANPQHQLSAELETLLELRAVAKCFGAREVLKNISLNIASGEFLTLLGESGSGKTTLLRLVAGFEQPTAGEIWMSGQRLDAFPPYKRRVNTVFQHYALFPHLSVRENVAYGLRVQRTSATEIVGRVHGQAARAGELDGGGRHRRIGLAGGNACSRGSGGGRQRRGRGRRRGYGGGRDGRRRGASGQEQGRRGRQADD